MDKAEQFLKENPVIFGMGLLVLGFLTLTTPSKGRPEIPELSGRRNSAWRGKGSFGKAPFGSQISHRSR